MPTRTSPQGSAPGAPRGVPGIDAGTPRRIPAAGWRQVLRRVVTHAHAERLPVHAAGIAFFAILSVAPVLVTALSVYGAVNTPEQAEAQLAAVATRLPDELQSVVVDQLRSITNASSDVLTVRGLGSLLLALWTATAATASLVDALTLAYHEQETRGFLRRILLALAIVLGGALLLGAVLAVGGLGARALADTPSSVRLAARIAAWVLLGLLMAAVLAVLYRLAPDRRSARWQWLTWGSIGVTVTWVLTSAALFAWVQQLGTYSTTYGSLAGVAVSMLWLWITVFLVLLGAVVNAEAERQTSRDSTVGPDRRPGERGAVVADSVPPYPGDRPSGG